MKVFKATAVREDEWWTIEVPDLTSPGPGGKTIVAIGAAPGISDIDQAARDLIAAWFNIRPDEVTVEVFFGKRAGDEFDGKC